MLEVARRNAERAGFGPHVRFQATPFADGVAPAPHGLLLMNPPYGRRLDAGGAARLGREIGRVLRARFRGWRAGVLVGAPAIGQALGLRATAVHPLSNGGLRVKLMIFDLK